MNIIKKIIIFLILLVIVFFFGGNYYQNFLAALSQKKIEKIDQDGFGNSLFVNQNNIPFISYVLENGDLIFAQKNNREWQKEIVADDAFAGHKTSLAVDKNGLIAILYINKKNQLKLATKKYTNKKNKKYEKWEFENISNNAALSCNLVFDDKNNPHISFWSPGVGILYAKKEKGKWPIEVLDSGEVGWWNDISLDKKQQPHISYFDFKNGALLYLEKENGQWKKETVDFGKDTGRWNAILIDKNENVFISYVDADVGILKIAKKTKGGWSVEKIDDGGIIGEQTNISLDEKENLVVSYSVLSDNTFRIAKKINNNWVVSIVDMGTSLPQKKIKGDIGRNSSLFIDKEGKIYLLWQDLSQKKLKYSSKKNF